MASNEEGQQELPSNKIQPATVWKNMDTHSCNELQNERQNLCEDF